PFCDFLLTRSQRCFRLRKVGCYLRIIVRQFAIILLFIVEVLAKLSVHLLRFIKLAGRYNQFIREILDRRLIVFLLFVRLTLDANEPNAEPDAHHDENNNPDSIFHSVLQHAVFTRLWQAPNTKIRSSKDRNSKQIRNSNIESNTFGCYCNRPCITFCFFYKPRTRGSVAMLGLLLS